MSISEMLKQFKQGIASKDWDIITKVYEELSGEKVAKKRGRKSTVKPTTDPDIVPLDDISYLPKDRPKSQRRPVALVHVTCSVCGHVDEVHPSVAPLEDEELSTRYFCKDCITKRYA